MPDRNEEDRERLLGDFLQGGPRSEEWRVWRESLEKRLSDLKRQRREMTAGEDFSALDAMIDETETQINALATEEVISEFVEHEIALSLNTADADEEPGLYDDLSENGHH